MNRPINLKVVTGIAKIPFLGLSVKQNPFAHVGLRTLCLTIYGRIAEIVVAISTAMGLEPLRSRVGADNWFYPEAGHYRYPALL